MDFLSMLCRSGICDAAILSVFEPDQVLTFGVPASALTCRASGGETSIAMWVDIFQFKPIQSHKSFYQSESFVSALRLVESSDVVTLLHFVTLIHESGELTFDLFFGITLSLIRCAILDVSLQ